MTNRLKPCGCIKPEFVKGLKSINSDNEIGKSLCGMSECEERYVCKKCFTELEAWIVMNGCTPEGAADWTMHELGDSLIWEP